MAFAAPSGRAHRGDLAGNEGGEEEDQEGQPLVGVADRQGEDRLDEREVVGQEAERGGGEGRAAPPHARQGQHRQQVEDGEVGARQREAQEGDQHGAGGDCPTIAPPPSAPAGRLAARPHHYTPARKLRRKRGLSAQPGPRSAILPAESPGAIPPETPPVMSPRR